MSKHFWASTVTKLWTKEILTKQQYVHLQIYIIITKYAEEAGYKTVRGISMMVHMWKIYLKWQNSRFKIKEKIEGDADK